MKLKVNDKIRFTDIYHNVQGYESTNTVIRKLLKRNRPVRIRETEPYGGWFNVRFKQRNRWVHHHILVHHNDPNWIKVKSRHI